MRSGHGCDGSALCTSDLECLALAFRGWEQGVWASRGSSPQVICPLDAQLPA